MASPRFEVPSGAVDGTNTVFTVSRPYSIGSTAVFRNGLLQRRDFDDGWVETDPASGILTMKEPPSAFGFPDVVQIFYLDLTPSPPALPESMVINLHGKLTTDHSLSGKLSTCDSLIGKLKIETRMKGSATFRSFSPSANVCAGQE